jgi:hypothetical protein
MMPNPLSKLAVTAINGIGNRQGKTYSIARGALDPANATHLEQYGFQVFGDAVKAPSGGLQRIPAAQLQEFALFLIHQATDTALYVDNAGSDSLYRQGHLYSYRSPLIPISARAVAFIQETPANSLRLLLRAFTKDALELPVGTVVRMRERVQSGARDGALFRELRADATIRTYQQAQWDTQAPVVGDVMLGHNSIVVNTRHERYVLENARYVVDIINPATREFHILDGSSLWLRIVDTTAQRLIFAVIGSGKHRYTVMDAFNAWGAMSIWHCMALMQQHLYDDVPSIYDEITRHIVRARQQSGPVAQKLYQRLSGADTDQTGAFLRGMRRGQAFEKGDGYLSN